MADWPRIFFVPVTVVKRRHAGQPHTSGLTMENSMVSLRRQESDYLGEQAIVLVLGPGSEFIP